MYVQYRGGTWVNTDPGGGLFVLVEDVYNAPFKALRDDLLLLNPRFGLANGFPIISFRPSIIPQGFTIGMELVFYLLAPAIALLRPKWLLLLLLVGLAYMTMTALLLPNIGETVYKSLFSILPNMLIGSALYRLDYASGGRLPTRSHHPGCVGLFICLSLLGRLPRYR